MKHIICIAALLAVSGCSLLNPFRRIEPVEKIVTRTETYCPPINTLQRPNPISIPTPEFLVVVPGDERLKEAGAMICLTASQYAALAEVMENSIRYIKDSQEVLAAYEALAEAQRKSVAEINKED